MATEFERRIGQQSDDRCDPYTGPVRIVEFDVRLRIEEPPLAVWVDFEVTARISDAFEIVRANAVDAGAVIGDEGNEPWRFSVSDRLRSLKHLDGLFDHYYDQQDSPFRQRCIRAGHEELEKQSWRTRRG